MSAPRTLRPPAGPSWTSLVSMQLPARLRLNDWALAGDWTVNKGAAALNKINGRIAYRFHARDLHLVMGPAAPGTSVRFRVRIDGQPPGAAHGIDVDEQGNGTVDRTAAVSADPPTEAHRRSPVRDRVSRSGRGGLCFHLRLIHAHQLEVPHAIRDQDGRTRSTNTRRRFRSAAAAIGVAATQLGTIGSAAAQASSANRRQPRSSRGPIRRSAPLKQIDAGVLNVGYAEAGPADGPAVILLHGWPYDIHSYRRCRAAAGVGGLSGDRSVSARLRHDALSFERDAPQRPAVGPRRRRHRLHGCAQDREGRSSPAIDWGARTANIVAALWPERCKALVSVSGYLIGSQEAGKMPLPPKAELEWWYQYYFATERGRAGYEKYRRDFAKLIWQLASPKWDFDDATFDRSAAAFDNPDHVGIVIHNYRWRLGLGRRRAASTTIWSSGLPQLPSIAVPTITLEGDANGAPHPDPASMPRNSRANTRTAPSRAASGTTCRRKPHGPSPKRSLRSPKADRQPRRMIMPAPILSPTRRAFLAACTAVIAVTYWPDRMAFGADGATIRPFRVSVPEEQLARSPPPHRRDAMARPGDGR